MRLNTLVPSALVFAALLAAGTLHSASVPAGTLIKASTPAVYYVGADGKRYVFPNDKTYFTWYADFSRVTAVTDQELASYAIGGNVTYRPGVKLVKIQSDPKVYAVDKGGALRWLKTEAAAIALYGSGWSKQVDDMPDSFFVNYISGLDINSASDFAPSSATSGSATIDADKALQVPVQGNANSNTDVGTTGCAQSCALGSACVENACKAVPGPSAMSAKAFVLDTLETCFVGDPCAGGACCNVAGTSFADNANFKAVKTGDKYLYADKLQLCGRASVTTADRNRINSEFNDFANAVGADTQNRMSSAVSTSHITGQFTMSRVPGTCSWWVSPSDVRDRLGPQVDSSTDAVFVISSKTFDFGAVDEPLRQTVDQSAGLSGAGYTYLVKEWETDTSGAPDHSAMSEEFASQMSSSVDLGITNPTSKFIGNHCRDGRRDLDETGVDCGGLGCPACVY